MLKVYLAGPITGTSFKDSTDWRDRFKNILHREYPEIGIFSPLRGKDYLKQEMAIKSEYEDIPLSSARGITTRDYNDVKTSNLIVVNVLGHTKVSIGTVMEVAWAKSFSIPVILIMEKSGNVHDHPMINECIGYRVDSIEKAISLTKVILLP